MARLSGTERLDHRHVQVARHGLVRARVAVVEGELLGPVVRVLVRVHRGVHVLRAERRGSHRLGARLQRAPPHPARVVAVTEVAVRQSGGGRGALVRHGRRRRTRTRPRRALLPRRPAGVAGARSGHVHRGVARRGVHQTRRVSAESRGGRRVRHEVAALAGGEVAAAHQPLHVLVQVVQVVVIHEHHRVRWPARVAHQGGGHRRSWLPVWLTSSRCPLCLCPVLRAAPLHRLDGGGTGARWSSAAALTHVSGSRSCIPSCALS